MSVDTKILSGNGLFRSTTRTESAEASGDTLPRNPATQQDPASKTDGSNVPDGSTPQNQTSSSSRHTPQPSLLASLWSPISSLQKSISGYTSTPDTAPLGTSSEQNERDGAVETAPHSVSTPDIPSQGPTPQRPSPDSKTTSPARIDSSPTTNENTNTPPDSNPTPILPPAKTPTYTRLQKTRLSGTRTKQLLRAGSRAHDDPPPPPELGACCGSSCDPCVNDLWREEREVWREVWGVHAVEGGMGREGLEW